MPTIGWIFASCLWQKFKTDMTQFIRQCDICQLIKVSTNNPYGLLQSLPIPSMVWNDISMDFITHLQSSGGKTAIWVIVDQFSKYSYFISLPNQFGVVCLANLFMKHIYRLHGIPSSVIFDRDPIFLSFFWKLMCTKLWNSTAYHSQSNGQTEVVNMFLQNCLRSFASDIPRTWNKFLQLVEF